MQLSSNNILSKIPGTDKSIIINLLSGNADVLARDKADEIERKNFSNLDEYTTKGYLVDPDEEKNREKRAYLDFIDGRDTSEIQLFFVPWYSCNFSCGYCYQAGYENPVDELTHETIDRFFAFVSSHFEGRRKYITLFGGEPFLPETRYEEAITYMIDSAARAHIDIAAVTNGYAVERYIRHLASPHVREIQVTLDGTRDVHDTRRPLADTTGTFDRIVAGIDMLVSARVPVNLRIVLDRENIDNLPAFSRFIIEKGWMESGRFKTQIGRNYELHTPGAYECGKTGTRLFDRLTMYEAVLDLCERHPEIREVFTPQFAVMKHLFQNGKLPEPLFDACPACKTEWAFDYTGGIYPCTATVGKADERLGTFSPRTAIDEGRVREWEKRDIFEIKKCTTCSLRLACGGGCGSAAKNRTGSVTSEDCRPIAGLAGLGVRYYFPETLNDE